MTVAPISLYFGIEDGKRADLEVIAKATIEWIEVIRELASIVAPGVEFEIEFVESEEGSVWLSSLIKAVRDGDRKALAAITSAVLLFFAAGPALHIQSDFGDAFWEMLGHEHKVEISEEDKADIAQKVAEAIRQTSAEDRRRNLIREVERDGRITSVGVGFSPRPEGPISQIPREQFPAIGAKSSQGRMTIIWDTHVQRNVRVKIIRANLKEGEAKLRWRFSEGETEWSADIEDEEFIYALNAKNTGLPLAVGQYLIVDVAIDRRMVEGGWQEQKRRVTRVIEPPVKRRQGSFDLRGQ